MKIRIAGNSIRFRLKQPEVKSFFNTGLIEELIEFGPEPEDKICFRLQRTSQTELGIEYEKNAVTVFVPELLTHQWTQTEQVGLNGKLLTTKGKTVSVLVEKDFACLDATEAENEGTYPNPLIDCQPVK